MFAGESLQDCTTLNTVFDSTHTFEICSFSSARWGFSLFCTQENEKQPKQLTD